MVEHTCQASTNGPRCAFRDVKRCQHGRSSDAQTGDESADIHDGEAAFSHGPGLKDNADNGDDAGADQGPPSSPAVCQPGGNETGGKAAGLQG